MNRIQLLFKNKESIVILVNDCILYGRLIIIKYSQRKLVFYDTVVTVIGIDYRVNGWIIVGKIGCFLIGGIV